MGNYYRTEVHMELQGHPAIPIYLKGLKFCSVACARLATDEDNQSLPKLIFPEPGSLESEQQLAAEELAAQVLSRMDSSVGPGRTHNTQYLQKKEAFDPEHICQNPHCNGGLSRIFYLRGHNEVKRVNAQNNVNRRIRELQDIYRRSAERGIDLRETRGEIDTRNFTYQSKMTMGTLFCSEKCLQMDNDAGGAANRLRLRLSSAFDEIQQANQDTKPNKRASTILDDKDYDMPTPEELDALTPAEQDELIKKINVRRNAYFAEHTSYRTRGKKLGRKKGGTNKNAEHTST